MNNRFGRDDRYRGERYRDRRFDRFSEERLGDERWLRSPDQEFETSEPYRQPQGDQWRQGPRSSYGDGPGGYGEGGYGGYRRPSYQQPGYAPPPSGSEPRGGYAGRGPKGYTRTDDRIKEDVCDRLSWNDEVDATDITVLVDRGEVTLEGSVATRHMKRLATDIAEDVPGVLDVHNTIRVTKPILTELKDKLTGEDRDEHHANTGTRTPGVSSGRNGVV